MENILHLSLDLLGLSNVPGLEVGGYLDSMLNNIPPIYFVTLATSFLIVGLSICMKMERDRWERDETVRNVYIILCQEQ